MKTTRKHLIHWISLTILLTVFWIAGLMTGAAIFPNDLMSEAANHSGESGTRLMFVIAALNTAVTLFFIVNARIRGLKLAAAIFLITFGIQWFMSQIETLWFNDSLQLPVYSIYALITGGAITASLFAVAATWITGNFGKRESPAQPAPETDCLSITKMTALLAVVIWPLVYFLAGYLIAWQFEAVRLFYSGKAEMDSFASLMKDNLYSGLYFFQIFRGILWVLIALLVLKTTTGSWLRKGIILGLLISVLGSSGLLLPNPAMSEEVRMAHLLETGTSGFLWGMIMAWFLGRTAIHETNNPGIKPGNSSKRVPVEVL